MQEDTQSTQEDMQPTRGNKSKFIGFAILVILIVAGLAFVNSNKKEINTNNINTDNSGILVESVIEDDFVEIGEEVIRGSYTLTPGSYITDVSASELGWEGRKITGGGHYGIVDFKTGSMIVGEDGEVTEISLVVDMTSIIDYEENLKLIDHLKSDDFFSVDTYPESSLVVTSITKLASEKGIYDVVADLTIKGITNQVSFQSRITQVDDFLEVESIFKIDRILWDIRFGSTQLGPDGFIKDEIEFDIIMTADRQ